MDVQAYSKIFEPEGRDILLYTWTSINYEYNNVLHTLFVFYDANTLYRISIYNLGIGYDLHKMLVAVVSLGNKGPVRLRPHR